MGLFRIYPSKDNWITNAHPDNDLSVRASGSNHGKSPSLSVFARKGDISSSSIELGRSLIQFSLTELSGLVFDEDIIPSSSVNYFLRLYNEQTDDTLPSSFDIAAHPLSRSWEEGTGIDNDNHLDLGYSSWKDATSTVAWTVTGSDFLTSMSSSQHFDNGHEDFEVNVTSIVNAWLTGGLQNNGFLLKLIDENESNSVNYYRKAFHGRESLYVDRLPYIEARWNSVFKDNRGNFGFNIPNTLAFYNNVRGELTTLSAPITLQIKDSLVPGSASYSASFTAAEVSTGIFTASVNISATGSYSGSVFYDIWTAGGSTRITGSFIPKLLTGSQTDINDKYILNVKNLKAAYTTDELARLIVNVRKKDFMTHVGVLKSGSKNVEVDQIEKMYYSVINDESGETIIPFATSSNLPYTQLSYNNSGNYFDLWFNSFVPGFKYRLLFLLDINNDKQILDEDLVFRVK